MAINGIQNLIYKTPPSLNGLQKIPPGQAKKMQAPGLNFSDSIFTQANTNPLTQARVEDHYQQISKLQLEIKSVSQSSDNEANQNAPVLSKLVHNLLQLVSSPPKTDDNTNITKTEISLKVSTETKEGSQASKDIATVNPVARALAALNLGKDNEEEYKISIEAHQAKIDAKNAYDEARLAKANSNIFQNSQFSAIKAALPAVNIENVQAQAEVKALKAQEKSEEAIVKAEKKQEKAKEVQEKNQEPENKTDQQPTSPQAKKPNEKDED